MCRSSSAGLQEQGRALACQRYRARRVGRYMPGRQEVGGVAQVQPVQQGWVVQVPRVQVWGPQRWQPCSKNCVGLGV